ncbi:uncharacterized protein [Panulirus ornatus]|uniref:uncharacterized protein n=1 Tax=Panulirus ornatus TaxID=150431 RepID=UPI003A8A8B7D
MLSSPGVSEGICPIIFPSVPVEATAFLGAVAAFVVFLFVLFLYLNKKLCFYTVGGFPCCDDPVTKSDKLKELGEYPCPLKSLRYSVSPLKSLNFKVLGESHCCLVVKDEDLGESLYHRVVKA